MKILLLVLALVGCGVQTDSEVKLIKGKVVPAGQASQVIALSPTGCSATVVGPHTIITAGHCYASNKTTSFTYRGKKYAATTIRHPNYNNGSATYDFTLGHVSETMPGPYYSIHPNYSYSVGSAVQMYGYGCINPKTWWGGGANGADGKLRTGQTQIIANGSLEITTRGGKDKSAACFGDSGAPL